VLPNVSGEKLHGIVDAVEAEAIAARPGLAEYIPPRAPSPWRRERDEWLPAVDVVEGPAAT
jgi:hypothetical protein